MRERMWTNELVFVVVQSTCIGFRMNEYVLLIICSWYCIIVSCLFHVRHELGFGSYSFI